MKIIKLMKAEEVRLRNSISKRKRVIRKSPEGELHCHRNGKYYNWYCVTVSTGDDGRKHRERSLIPKADAGKAVGLAVKGFNEDAMKTEQRQLRAIQMFLKYYDTLHPGERFLSRSGENRRLYNTTKNLYGYSEDDWNWMTRNMCRILLTKPDDTL